MKPLTIEQLKSLEVGDWVWIKFEIDNPIDRRYAKQERYFQIIEPKNDTAIRFNNYVPMRYSDYGTKWLAYKNKEQADSKSDVYKEAFELILQDVYETRLQADILSCSSCPFMFELFDGCENQGLYEDCKRRWNDYYLAEAERRLAELTKE